MCIFDLEFLSNADSLWPCRTVSLLPLLVSVGNSLTRVPTPAAAEEPLSGLRFCPSLLSPSWELAVMFFILLQLLILRPRPLGRRLSCLWGQREVGVGGRSGGGSAGCSGHPALPQCCSHSCSGQQVWGGAAGGNWGEGRGSAPAHADLSGGQAQPGGPQLAGRPGCAG